ncbi:MAG: hypothetical protein RL398_2227 [Planctomycetota bacterium]|jgi:hypothetical protein
MSGPIQLRPFQPGDEQGLLAGHNGIFQPHRTLAHWQWKFRDNPTGLNHTMLAVHETEGIVGAYVTIPTKFRADGAEVIGGQCVDLWVRPEHRRAGPRPGLFVNMALAHYERWGGKNADQNAFHYGWPIATWRIGQRYLKYEMVRDWDFLFREVPPGGVPTRAVSDDLDVVAVQRFSTDVDGLWDRLKDQSRLQIVRDARFLNWRYADAHDATYQLWECRERTTGALRGLAVTTLRDFLFPRTAFLADWLVPADDYDATAALLARAERRAGEQGASALATQFNHLDPRFLLFQRRGYQVYGTSYFQVVIPFTLDDTLWFKDHWYCTPGDSDLI